MHASTLLLRLLAVVFTGLLCPSAPGQTKGVAAMASTTDTGDTESRDSPGNSHPSQEQPQLLHVFDDMFSSPMLKMVLSSQVLTNAEASTLHATIPDRIIQLSHGMARYICELPTNLDVLPMSPLGPTDAEQNHIIVQALDKLSHLDSSCMTHNDRLWYYEFCPEKYVRQHYSWPSASGSASQANLEYFLGYFDAAFAPKSAGLHAGYPTKPNLVEGGDSGQYYLRQTWGFGAFCEDTGEHRTVEIQYHCCSEEHISYLREYSICKYILVVHTPLMCFHPIFKTQQKDAHGQIECMQLAEDSESAILATKKMYNDEKDTMKLSTLLSSHTPGHSESVEWLTLQDMATRGCKSPIKCRSSSHSDKLHPNSLDQTMVNELLSGASGTIANGEPVAPSGGGKQSSSAAKKDLPISSSDMMDLLNTAALEETTIDQEFATIRALKAVRHKLGIARRKLNQMRSEAPVGRPVTVAGMEDSLSPEGMDGLEENDDDADAV
ncbi:hypothetical protein BASA50_009943 [Batrachochytrium salamandrivorans]|uniref:Protein OS-9 homolog n=1 Tax=Batrachochytrium salamandrivorans TaxID=1357716 RepID=A0ABQ8EZW8_9FUNG|nr:hypothetical protein BASA60_009979 [Batrachochytrium salamandrivorans]KAH6589588.1 hypothetical protein BASA50_009943 [Batrachochytrium salamandrivorans]